MFSSDFAHEDNKHCMMMKHRPQFSCGAEGMTPKIAVDDDSGRGGGLGGLAKGESRVHFTLLKNAL